MNVVGRNTKILYLTGCLLISTISIILIISSLCFLVGIGISAIHFPISFFFSCLAYFIIYKKDYEKIIFFKSILISLIVIALSILFALLTYDISYDGQTYHMECIYQLKNGWNPFKNLLDDKINLSIYINHYAKGVEIPQSTIYSLINRIEASKATNFIVLAGSFCLIQSYLLSLKISRFKGIIIGCFTVLNPITINQLLSTYVDGQLSSIILCFIVTFLMILKRADSGKLILLGLISILAINIKFTGAVYSMLFILLGLVWLLATKRFILLKKLFITSSISTIIAFLLVGFNPYVVNTLQFKHPFYPLMGENHVDIMSLNLPDGFEGKSTAYKFFYSFFGRTDNVLKNGKKVELKVPLSINKTDIVNAPKIDTRIAGFGPMFSGIFIISVILLFIKLIKDDKNKTLKGSIVLILVLCLSTLLNPESWWARYVPQLWYIPIIAIVIIELFGAKKEKFLINILYLFYFVNLSFTLTGLGYNFLITQIINYQINTLKTAKQPIEVQWNTFSINRTRFIENGIPYIEKDLSKRENTNNIARSSATFVVPKSKQNLPKTKLILWAEKL